MGVVALVQGFAGSLYTQPDYSKGYGCGCYRNIDRLAKYRKHKGRKEVGRWGGGEGDGRLPCPLRLRKGRDANQAERKAKAEEQLR